jgi:hypothetical protein
MGHGYMQKPSSRNLEAFQRGDDYNFMGLSAGGVSYVYRNSIDGRYIYPDTVENGNKRHGMCGDPVGLFEKYNQNVEEYPIVSTFQKGQTIGVDIVITSHHLGHFEFYICNKDDLKNPQDGITQECLYKYQLLRDDTVETISPVDQNYPHRYYLEPPECMEHQTFPYPGYKTTVFYKLPHDLFCDHCVLQWWYFTGNSCNHVGYDEYEGTQCEMEWYNRELPKCEDSSRKPEEFWNCADIKIERKCISINNKVTDTWCQQVHCDNVFHEYCAFEDNKEEYTCKSIDLDIPDKWCQNVECSDAYHEYCLKEYK